MKPGSDEDFRRRAMAEKGRWRSGRAIGTSAEHYDQIADLSARPALQHVVVTGRGALPGMIEAADTVTEMNLVKHAFKAGVKAQKGIEF